MKRLGCLMIWLITLFLLAAIGPAAAQGERIINYQGRLTDDLGEPVTATVSMTFTIYDAETDGDSKWTETHPSVSVVDGLFSVILGSVVLLPDTVFTGDDRYLGIAVGGDSEISQRTLFTSAPSALYAKKIAGDIQTEEGVLTLANDSDDPAIVLETEPGMGATRVQLYSKETTPEDLIELKVANDGSGWGSEMTMYLAGQPGQTLMKKVGMPSGASSFKMYSPELASPNEMIGLNIAWDEEESGWASDMSMYLAGAPGQTLMKKVGMPSGENSLKMYCPDIATPNELIGLNVYDEGGGAWASDMTMYLAGHPGKVMMKKTGAASTGGSYTIYAASPTDEGKSLELASVPGGGGSFTIYAAEPTDEGVNLEMRSSPGGSASFKMFNPQPEPPIGLLEMDVTESAGFWESRLALYNHDGGPEGKKTFEVKSTNIATDMKIFDYAAPDPYSSNAVIGSADGIGQVWLGQGTNLASALPYIAGKSTSTMSDFTIKGGTLSRSTGPVIFMEADATSAKVGIGVSDPGEKLVVGKSLYNQPGELITVGTNDVSGGAGLMFGYDENNMGRMVWDNNNKYITFLAREEGTTYNTMYLKKEKVGIGVSNPDENLVVGKNIGARDGNRIMVGDDTPGVTTGLVFGKDGSNRAWILWNVDSSFVGMGTEESGGLHGGTLNLRTGKVGIQTTEPSYALDVDGDIQCVTLHETSDSRLKSDVEQIEDALSILTGINGVTFAWNDFAESQGGEPGRQDIGVLAEEVESVLPELVYTDDQGYKSVSYTKLVPVLIEAVKELRAENAAKSDEIELMRAELADVKALLEKMLDQ